MRINQYLAVLLLVLLTALFVYQGLGNSINSSVEETAEKVRKVNYR